LTGRQQFVFPTSKGEKMFAERQLQQWWAARSDEQRATLKQATQSYKLEPDTVKLLFDTACPFGSSGGKWETQPEWDWNWPLNVREFIASQ
jgi:hypothetical protein